MPEKQSITDRFLKLHPEFFQKILLQAAIKSVKFYVNIKAVLCPFEAERKGRRPDFHKPEFNRVYGMVADYWEAVLPSLVPTQDYCIGIADLEELLRGEILGGRLNAADATAIFDELKSDYELFEFPPDVLSRLSSNEQVVAWLKLRAAANISDFIHSRRMLKVTTLEEMNSMIKAAQIAVRASSTRLVQMSDLLYQKVESNVPLPTDLPELNKALGGGFRPRTTTLVAGINGGGKTILACQWAKHYAASGASVVVFTTEQPPEQLAQRVASNYLQVGFDRFTQTTTSTDLSMSERRGAMSSMSIIPEDLFTTHAQQIEEFYYKVWKKLFFVDWAGSGLAVYRDFDSEMDRICEAGFDPDVVIFDWIGGGLDNLRDAAQSKLDLRALYKEAIEILINHGKRTNRVMIAMAQLNKANVGPKKKYVVMSDLAECKSMTDNVTNFIGISALRNFDSTSEGDGVKSQILSKQYLNVDKARMGPCGAVPVEVAFRIQAFKPFVGTSRHLR